MKHYYCLSPIKGASKMDINEAFKKFQKEYASAYNGYNYERIMRRFLRDKSFSTADFERIKAQNLIINTVICFICVFILKLDYWLLPIAYILTDILLFNAEKIMITYYYNMYESSDTPEKLSKLISKIEKLHSKKSQLYSTEKEKASNSYSYDYSYIEGLRDEISVLDSNLSRLNKRLKTYQEQELLKSDVVAKKEIENVEGFRKIISAVEGSIYENLSDTFKQYIKKSISITKELLEEIENNKGAFDLVHTTFNVYFSELVNVITQIGSLSADQQIYYIKTLEEVLKEYEEHIDRLKERVKSFNQKSIDVNLSTLLTELKKGE